MFNAKDLEAMRIRNAKAGADIDLVWASACRKARRAGLPIPMRSVAVNKVRHNTFVPRYSTAVRKEALKDRGNRLMITIDDETLCVMDWARRVDTHPQTIYSRIRKGWDPVEAVLNC
jgi:hypothetical protein